MEAVRIITEMRGATNGEYPKIAVWENVPGAFSSNKGQDFRTVLEELIKIVEPNAVMPDVPKKGWAYADCYRGDGWSLAYRVLDAQYIRTAQRRRRIYLVLCLTNERAGEILFERQSLRGYPSQSRTQGQGTATNVEGSIGADDREGKCYGFPLGFRPENVRCYEETATTLCNGTRAGFCNGVVVGVDIYNQALTGDRTKTLNSAASDADHIPCTVYSVENHPNDSRVNIDDEGKVQALTGRMGTGGGDVPMVMERKPIAIDRAFFNQGKNALYDPQTYEDGTNPTIVAKGPSAVCYKNPPHYIVRRLTPTECARLQGFPDTWGHIEPKSDLTDEEYKFWCEVRNTHASINGKQVKDYTKKQMLTWYNKLWTDSAEYKMWGNGIALPCALYVMEGIKEIYDSKN